MSDSEDPRAEERVGRVLDEKWTLERILGSGGMGAVYAGRHRNGARGAVKVLHPELARRSDVRERFLREGYAANRVEHRGAVRVLDDDIVKEGPDEGTAYLVMEMLEGESLEERLDRGPPLTELELLPILDDVLAVLEAAHEHGVVHRDLKPANLFLNKDPAGPGVKVLDFGLARLEELSSMTGAGLALGTPSFMAPEQANGRSSEIDARTDLFAVGATAFKILAGRGVHEADGVLELVARMGTLPAPKLREVAPQVSEDVARVVDRALEFKREDRYLTAAAMRADVQSAQNRLSPPIPAVVAPAFAGSPVAVAPVVPAAASRIAAALEDTRLDALGPHASARSEVGHPPARRGSFAPIMVVVLVAVSLVIMLVPRLQERAGFAAMNDLWTSSPLGSALPPEPGAATPPEPSSPEPGPGPLSASASALDLADADADDADSADASEMVDAAAVDEDDASTSSALIDLDSGAFLDASADASDDDDEDEDDDDPDASVAAPVATRSTASAAPRPTAVKRPRQRPRPPSKHGRPRKKRRTRR